MSDMKVLYAEISKGTQNRRTRRTTGLVGCVITFESNTHMDTGSVVGITVDGKQHCFKVEEISTTEDNLLEFCAVEYGYWEYKINRKVDFDLRQLIGLDIELITDKEKLMQLDNSSSMT
jgi:hypothetical protein